MLKKIICLLTLIVLVTSCADSWSSVKRGLTGQKSKSTDEFLVEKKDPLILPPDYENLPVPSDDELSTEEISSFEKTIQETSSIEETTSTASSAEESILQKIRRK